MFQKNAKHRANVASNAVHRPPLVRVHQLIHFVSVEKALFNSNCNKSDKRRSNTRRKRLYAFTLWKRRKIVLIYALLVCKLFSLPIFF